MKHKAEMCPMCGSTNLYYEEEEPNIIGNTLYRQYKCVICDFVGMEEYALKFKKHVDLNRIKVVNLKNTIITDAFDSDLYMS